MELTHIINNHDLATGSAEGVLDLTNQETLMLQFSATGIPEGGIRCRVWQAIENTPEAYDIAKFENDKPISFLIKHEGTRNIPIVAVIPKFIKIEAESPDGGIINVKAV